MILRVCCTENINSSATNKTFWTDFGHQLASMHSISNDQFGFDEDNYIGSLHQSNTRHSDWISFFVEERLEKQVCLAYENKRIDKLLIRSFEHLYGKLGRLFPAEDPALIHGDLWSGNYMVDSEGAPCLIDPAVHYGHREVELSFTKLFGGFDSSMYMAYNEVFPLENGFDERVDLYNLYPLMVHVNIFGGSYLRSVQSILKKFV